MNQNQQGVQLIESEEDKKKKAGQSQPGSAFAGGTTSPTGAKPSPTGPVAPSGTQQARAVQEAGPTKGTGFTGVGRYLQANVGSRLGEQVAGRVAQTGQQAQTRLGQAVSQFGQQLGSKDEGTGLYGQLTTQQQAAQSALQRIAGKPTVSSVEQPQPDVSRRGKEYLSGLRDFQASLPPMSSSLQEKYDSFYGKHLVHDMRARSPEEKAREAETKKQNFLNSLTPEERAEYEARPQYNPKEFVKGYTPIEERVDRSQIPTGLTKYSVPNFMEKISGESPLAVDLTPSQEEVAAYQAVAGGQFQAPSGLQDIGDIRSQARLAGELAAGTRDTAGRLGLLRQVVGRGPQQYTKGQSALDALILGQSGGQLAAARRASAGLERKVGTEEMLAAERARQFGAESERAKAELVGGVTGLEKTVSGDISAQKSKYETDLDKLYTEIQEGVSKGEISKDTAELMKTLGFDPTSFSLYGINPEELKTVFERRQAGDITSATSATAEQLQKINALRSLSGQTPVYSAEDLEKAGTTMDPLTGLSLRAEDFKTAQEQQRASVKKAGEEFVRNLPSWQTEAGSLFTHSGAGMRGQQTIRRDLQERFNRGLYDPATGKLDEKLIKDLVDFWSTRTQYEGKDGFLGLGAGRYGRVEGDAERIAALQKLLGETQKTFKIKEE